MKCLIPEAGDLGCELGLSLALALESDPFLEAALVLAVELEPETKVPRKKTKLNQLVKFIPTNVRAMKRHCAVPLQQHQCQLLNHHSVMDSG